MSKRFFRDLDEDDSEEEAIFKTIQSNESNTTHGNRSIKPLEFMYGAGTPTATSSTRTNGVSAMNLAPNTNSSISVPRKKRKKFLDDSSSDDHFDSAPSTGRSQRANIFSSSNVVDGKDIAHSLSQVSSQSPPKKHKRIADFFADSDIDADDISVDIAKNVHEEEADSMPKATSASSSSAGDGAIDFVATYGLVERSYGDEYRPYVESGEYKQANQELILYASDEKRLVLHKYAARQLLNHQVEGAKWLAKKFVEKRGGILGGKNKYLLLLLKIDDPYKMIILFLDEMGLGKTIQVAAFLNALYGKTGTSDVDKEWMRLKKRHDSSTEYPSATCKSYCEVLPTLIICPKTLVDNWKRELNKWGYFLLDILTADLDHDDADSIISRALIQRSELVLISYSQVGKFCQALSKVHWNVVIYDEGHLLKNPNNQTYERIAMINKSDCRLILTGTPLQNNLGELWALLHLLDKARYPDKKTFSKEIERPMKLGMSSHASKEDVKLAKKAQEVVDEIISDCLIQRKKNVLTGDSALKGKDEIIVLCDLSTLQQELYEYCLSLPDFENVRFHATLCPCNSGAMRAKCCPEFRFPYQRSLLPNQFKIDERAALWKEFHSNNNPCNPDRRVACPLCILLPCLNTLSKIASHPMLIQADPKSADVEKQNKTERFISATFPPDLVEKLGGTKRSNRFMTMKSTEISGKMKTLREMLAHFIRNDEKSLVFSIRTQVLDVLEAMCIAEGWKFLRLDGQTATKRRQQLVDEYNKDGDLMIFLISSKAGGVGLNLCSANKVIIFDVDWNPVVDMQSQDRAYRIGQMEHVSVYRLVAKGTIEEVNYVLQLNLECN